MVWLPVKKIEDMFIRFDRITNVRDGQTHRRIPHDGIGRACKASRGKKHVKQHTIVHRVQWIMLIIYQPQRHRCILIRKLTY